MCLVPFSWFSVWLIFCWAGGWWRWLRLLGRAVLPHPPSSFFRVKSRQLVFNSKVTCHVFTAMPVVLSSYSIEIVGSLPRVKSSTFRGHVLWHRDIPLARGIVVSPWLVGHSSDFRDSLPRFEILTFRGHVLRHRDIPLASGIAVSPWLGMPGCALPCFGFIVSRCFFVWGLLSGCWMSDVGLSGCWMSDVGLSGIGLPDCRVALEMGFRGVWGSFKSGRAQKPHTSPTTPSPALK